MHDPMTVAHEIYLGRKRTRSGRYRSPLITIWHVDPETDGTDDSCGYSRCKVTNTERDMLKKVSKNQYSQLFARKVAIAANQSYASVCYNQDTYGMIYWLWRHFNRNVNKARWQYGKPLANNEMQYVYQLATDPVDNFQSHKINSLKDFEETVYLIYRCWKTYKRKWYQHPKWHIHHWKVQFHPWQNLKRRYWDKCCICGKRGFKKSPIGDWGGTKRWHQECDNNYTSAPKSSTKP